MKKKIRLIGIFIAFLVIIAGVIIFIFKTQIVKHFIPTVDLPGVINIRVINDTSYISSKLTVQNKSFFKIKIDSIGYKVSLVKKTCLQSQKFLGIVLHSHEKDTIDFSLKIPYIMILKELKAARKKSDSADYSINVYLQYSTVLGKVKIPINKSAKIKIPLPPELKIVEIKYTKVHLKSILAVAKIEIINHSIVNLSIKDMSYSMSILKRANLKGNLKDAVNIKPNGKTFINLPIEISINKIAKTIFEVIINKDHYDYTLTLNAFFESSDPLKQSFHINVINNGKMELKK
jgi:LEA14-like dessication related protein